MLPTFSAIGYSIGMTLAGRKQAWTKLTQLSPMPHTAAIVAAWTLPFIFLVLSAHRFERSRIEKWSGVRSVIDPQGLSLSADASQLCSTSTPGGSPLLPTGTMVEGLERRICFNRRVLDQDVQRPANSWTVERVRILTGFHIGAEGWVPSYGLLEELQH